MQRFLTKFGARLTKFLTSGQFGEVASDESFVELCA